MERLSVCISTIFQILSWIGKLNLVSPSFIYQDFFFLTLVFSHRKRERVMPVKTNNWFRTPTDQLFFGGRELLLETNYFGFNICVNIPFQVITCMLPVYASRTTISYCALHCAYIVCEMLRLLRLLALLQGNGPAGPGRDQSAGDFAPHTVG